MNPYQKRKQAIEKKLREHADAYKAVLDKAKEEERQPTEEDRADISQHVEAIEVLKKELAEVEANIKTLDEVTELSKFASSDDPETETKREPARPKQPSRWATSSSRPMPTRP